MAGTHEGGIKAAETRKKNHPEGSPGSLSAAGRKGGENSHGGRTKDKSRNSEDESGGRQGSQGSIRSGSNRGKNEPDDNE